MCNLHCFLYEDSKSALKENFKNLFEVGYDEFLMYILKKKFVKLTFEHTFFCLKIPLILKSVETFRAAEDKPSTRD